MTTLAGLAAEALRQREQLLRALIATDRQHPLIAGLPALDATPLLDVGAVTAATDNGRLEAADFLRAFADKHHQRGEGYAQRVDYGTGVEYGQACTCGADWGENERHDGCTERLEILAEADRIEAGASGLELLTVDEPATDKPVDPEADLIADLYRRINGDQRPHAMSRPGIRKILHAVTELYPDGGFDSGDSATKEAVARQAGYQHPGLGAFTMANLVMQALVDRDADGDLETSL